MERMKALSGGCRESQSPFLPTGPCPPPNVYFLSCVNANRLLCTSNCESKPPFLSNLSGLSPLDCLSFATDNRDLDTSLTAATVFWQRLTTFLSTTLRHKRGSTSQPTFAASLLVPENVTGSHPWVANSTFTQGGPEQE